MSSNLDVSPPPVSSGDEAEPPRPEPDGVRGGVIILVAIATAVITALSVWIAWEIASSAAHDDRAGRWEAPSDQQAIEMSLLPRSDRAADRRSTPRVATARLGREGQAEARRRFSSYGYNDRDRGTVHIPLARAKQLYLERERSRSAAMQSTPAPRTAP